MIDRWAVNEERMAHSFLTSSAEIEDNTSLIEKRTRRNIIRPVRKVLGSADDHTDAESDFEGTTPAKIPDKVRFNVIAESDHEADDADREDDVMSCSPNDTTSLVFNNGGIINYGATNNVSDDQGYESKEPTYSDVFSPLQDNFQVGVKRTRDEVEERLINEDDGRDRTESQC